MPEYKIESNIPMPVRKAKSKYPFAEMKVGDSFQFELRRGKATHIQTAAFYAAKKLNMKFAIRETRCWRIK